MGNLRATPFPEPSWRGCARAEPSTLPQAQPSSTEENQVLKQSPAAWSRPRGQRLAAVVVVCYFREGPFCILKRGLGFSPALTRDPGATAAPRGLGQAWATPPALGRCLPGPGSSGPERPPWSPLCRPRGHLVLGGEVPPQPRRDTCPLPPVLLNLTKSRPWGLRALLAMGLLVTCTLRWTFRLRTFLPDDASGAVSPHLRRDPSCEAERLHHKRTHGDHRGSNRAGRRQRCPLQTRVCGQDGE